MLTQTLTFSILLSFARSVSVSVPSSLPNNTSPKVSAAFPGFAFEEAAFVRYTTDDDGSPNTFSRNLIKAVTDRTGGRAVLRVGGTSQDFARYISVQTEPVLPVENANNGPALNATRIGPNYWKIAKAFPDVDYTIALPLAMVNSSETELWAKSVIDILGWDRIQALELGNEPNLYDNAGENSRNQGPPLYQEKQNDSSYAALWNSRVEPVFKAIGKKQGDRVFQAFDTASGGVQALDVKTVFGLGIDNTSSIKQVGQHYYQTQSGQDLSVLMNHSTVTQKCDPYKPTIAFLQDYGQQHGIDMQYIFSETASGLDFGTNKTYTQSLGTALWTVDFNLHAMSIGVSGIRYQNIMKAPFHLWSPVDSADLPKNVYGHYYAMPFSADLMGPTNGNTKVASLDLSGQGVDTDHLTAYAAFEDDDTCPKRMAIVNLDLWIPSSGDRPNQTLTLEGVQSDSVWVTQLSSPQGATAFADSITYGGSQWTADSNGEEVKGVRNDSFKADVQNGQVTLSVEASSAILVYLKCSAQKK